MIEVFSGGKRIPAIDVTRTCWIDCSSLTPEEAGLLQEAYSLHPLTVEDLLNADTRIKVEEFPEYLFCVFYGVEKKKSLRLYEIDFLLGKNVIITSHKAPVPSFQDLKAAPERLLRLQKKSSDLMFHRLLDIEVDNYFPVLGSYDDQIEALEDRATFRPGPPVLKEILRLKREIVSIRRAVQPQREKLSFLAKNENRFISKKAIPYFRDVYDHSIRVSDNLDNYREAVGNTFDVYMSSVSNNMNEAMKVLSVIATIALPLTVISGIWGTNFETLPWSGWDFGFWAMILGMAVLSSGMILFFRKRGWF